MDGGWWVGVEIGYMGAAYLGFVCHGMLYMRTEVFDHILC